MVLMHFSQMSIQIRRKVVSLIAKYACKLFRFVNFFVNLQQLRTSELERA